MSAAESLWIGMSFATGFPCFVMTRPSGPTVSSKERHCALNCAAPIVFMPTLLPGTVEHV